MASGTTPTSVSKRRATIVFTDIAIAVVVFSAALQFFYSEISQVVWILAGISAVIGTNELRRSIKKSRPPINRTG